MTVTIYSLIFFMEVIMEAIVERCAGLDVHLDTVVACILYGEYGYLLEACMECP